MTDDRNRKVFSDPVVVAYYDQKTALHESEHLLFQTFLKKGMAVLDIGVGAGRTTPYLSGIAARYVGVDYSDAMIAKCRSKFPTLSFLTMDASDMSVFPDNSFDAIVFSFNGIDCLPNDEVRAKCFGECSRILEPGGILILSSHNARHLFFTPVLHGVGAIKKVWRLLYASVATMWSLPPRIASKAFWRGAGYVRERLGCGGATIYVSTPDRFAKELQSHGFTVARVVGAQHPGVERTLAVPWYYYACVKTDPRDSGLG